MLDDYEVTQLPMPSGLPCASVVSPTNVSAEGESVRQEDGSLTNREVLEKPVEAEGSEGEEAKDTTDAAPPTRDSSQGAEEMKDGRGR